jgi:nucleoid-associated protein YgaU
MSSILDRLFGRGKKEEEEKKEQAQRVSEEAARKRREELAAEKKMMADARKRFEEQQRKKEGEKEKAKVKQIYVVKSGDSLSKIAKELMGDAKRWPEIYELNKELIGDDPNLIHPGQELKIPE